MGRLTLFTLKLSRDLLGTEIPEKVKGERILFYSFLRRRVMEGISNPDWVPYRRKALFLLLLEGPLEVAKAIAGRLFPSGAELRVRYGLGEGDRLWPWYLLNPLLLPLTVLTKGRGWRRAPPAP